MSEGQSKTSSTEPGVADARHSVRSMTGFHALRVETRSGELTVSLRSVNHRGLDLHFYLGQEFAPFENEMRTLLKDGIRRGHVEVRVSLSRSKEGQLPGYNGELLASYVAGFRKAAADLDLTAAEPDLNVLITLPGVLAEKQRDETLDEGIGRELLTALARCVAELNGYREREGGALRDEMESQATEIESDTKAISEIRSAALPKLQERMREKISELVGTAGISESRLVEEAALLVDRSDIQEELTRLTVHSAELRRILNAGGEAGKRIDFLLQEMNREANTTLAKSAGAGEPGLQVTNFGLSIKANIERIREQALNLE